MKNGQNMMDYMAALMFDVVSGDVSPQVARAAIAAGSVMLRVAEMNIRFAAPSPERRTAAIPLCG